jgi:hypothetical protein
MNKFASRKFIFACAIVAVGAALNFSGQLDGSGFVTLALGIFGLYAGSNVGDKKVLGQKA